MAKKKKKAAKKSSTLLWVLGAAAVAYFVFGQDAPSPTLPVKNNPDPVPQIPDAVQAYYV